MKVKLTPNPSGRGVSLAFYHAGTETITYFNAPPKSIDHVDVEYLQKRGLWNITTKKQLKHVQEEFKKYMQNLSDTISTNNQSIKFYSIPEWAKYIAMDDNGKWWAFEIKPELSKDEKEWNSSAGHLEEVYIECSSTLMEVNR